jgi:excisionase family DNA binding protein
VNTGTRRKWRSRVTDEDLELLGEPLVSAEAVAKFLGVDRSTVYRMAGKPDGIACVEVGERVRFRPSDVRAYLERNTVRQAAATRAKKLLRSVT